MELFQGCYENYKIHVVDKKYPPWHYLHTPYQFICFFSSFSCMFLSPTTSWLCAPPNSCSPSDTSLALLVADMHTKPYHLAVLWAHRGLEEGQPRLTSLPCRTLLPRLTSTSSMPHAEELWWPLQRPRSKPRTNAALPCSTDLGANICPYF